MKMKCFCLTAIIKRSQSIFFHPTKSVYRTFSSQHLLKNKDYLKGDDKGESSTLFYLPSTTDWKESLNQFKGNVQLHPIDCTYEKFREYSSKKWELSSTSWNM